MRSDYTEVFRDTAAVDRYQRVAYGPGTYDSAVDRRQRAWLREFARGRFAVQHDFACGAGRALAHLSGVVPAAHGYDSSPQMLDAARRAGCAARLHLVAADGPVPEPAPAAGPALVTVFRLLLNAPPEVRDRAVAFAARALPDPDAGLLVVGNHGNPRSLRHLARRRNRGNHWFAELDHRTVGALLDRYGFQLVARYGFALAPPGAYRRSWSRPVVSWLDDRAAGRALAALSTDLVYVARRRPG